PPRALHSFPTRRSSDLAPGARIEVLRRMPRALERLRHDPLGRPRVHEQAVDLSVQGKAMALAKLVVCIPITCGHTLYSLLMDARSEEHRLNSSHVSISY